VYEALSYTHVHEEGTAAHVIDPGDRRLSHVERVVRLHVLRVPVKASACVSIRQHPSAYVSIRLSHVERVVRLHVLRGSIKALLARYEGAIKALLRRY
jgi:hypothetical protein